MIDNQWLTEWISVWETNKTLKIYTSKKIPKAFNMVLNINLPEGIYMLKQENGKIIKLKEYKSIDTNLNFNYSNTLIPTKIYSLLDTLAKGTLNLKFD